MANSNDHNAQPAKPVRDDGLAPRPVPFYKGQQYQGDLATRKAALLDSGPGIGYVPGHQGTRRGSSLHAGGVHEATLPDTNATSFGKISSGLMRRPMPREIPVHTQTTHFGNVTRYLDGHSEIHRERPGLVEYMHSLDPNDPNDADEREQVRMEIAHRDAIHNHRYW